MFRRTSALSLLLIVMLAGALPAYGQTPPGAERIIIEGEDGLELVGNYYVPEGLEEPAPAVLLMHHGGGQKESWYDFAPLLVEAGYVALAVDLRAHGETGGGSDWDLGLTDAIRWIDWLSEQDAVDPDHISIVGASIGGDLGLNVMAADERVQTIVVLSPAVEVDGITTPDAVEAIGDRPVFLVSGDGDPASMEAVITLFPLMSGDGQVRIYDTSACCTFFFLTEDDLADSIIAWLETYG